MYHCSAVLYSPCFPADSCGLSAACPEDFRPAYKFLEILFSASEVFFRMLFYIEIFVYQGDKKIDGGIIFFNMQL